MFSHSVGTGLFNGERVDVIRVFNTRNTNVAHIRFANGFELNVELDLITQLTFTL